MVESQPSKLLVAGSIPVSRSNLRSASGEGCPPKLALLQAIDRHRALNRVANEMRLSQPAITKALREVEDIFGTPLFTRSSRGLAPTAAGDAVLLHAKRWLADVESTSQVLAAIDAGHGGRVVAADNWLWRLFLVLQAAALLRLVSALWVGLQPAIAPWAAAAWGVAVLGWAGRYLHWYGTPRPDGRPG